MLLFGKTRNVVYSYREDDGGMYESTCGVFEENGKYHSFVKNGWGGGAHSPGHPDLDTAKKDIGRLWEKLNG